MKIGNIDFGDSLNFDKFKLVDASYGRHERSNNLYSLFLKYNKDPQPGSTMKKFTISGINDFSKVYEYAIYESDESERIWFNISDLEVLKFIQDKAVDCIYIVMGLIDPFDAKNNFYRMSSTVDGYEVIIYYHEINSNADMKKEKEIFEKTSTSFEKVDLGKWVNNDLQISEKRFCRRDKGSFKFITFYNEVDGTDKDVTVILTVDYTNRNYTISPGRGPKTFIFEGCIVSPIVMKNKYPMWKAVLQSINDAIDFAEKELRQ